MKSIFITLPQRERSLNIPLGILAIATELFNCGYKEIKIYDIDFLRPSFDSSIDKIVSYEPDLIGISAPVSTAYVNVKQYSSELKKRLPDALIVVGGNIVASAEVLLKKTAVDICIAGEGEIACRKLHDWVINGKKWSELKEIKGLVYFDDEDIVFTGYGERYPREKLYKINWSLLENLTDYLPEIVVENSFLFKYANGDVNKLTDKDKNLLGKRIFMGLRSARGCSNKCTFCHRFVKGVNLRPVQSVIEDIGYLVQKYNIGAFRVSDECFGMNRKWLLEFCDDLKEIGVTCWGVGGMRVDMVDEETILSMKDSGCRTIIFGFETMSNKMLSIMEKNVSSSTNIYAGRLTLQHGIFTVPQLVIGMPGEDLNTIRETAFNIAELFYDSSFVPEDGLSINYAQALPGTPLYEYGRLVGLIGKTIEEEEEYLIRVFDKDAADYESTVNFTGLPRILHRALRMIFRINLQYYMFKKDPLQYAEKYNSKNIKAQRLGTGLFLKYPRLVFNLQYVILFKAIMSEIRSKGIKSMVASLFELAKWVFSGKASKVDINCSLRKIIENSEAAYYGNDLLINLRRGQ